jgi:hypothetical protein
MKTNRTLRKKIEKLRQQQLWNTVKTMTTEELFEHVVKIYGVELDKANTEIARLRKLLENRTGCKPVSTNVSETTNKEAVK